MNKLFMTILIISVVGNFVGLSFAYKYFKLSRRIAPVQHDLLLANNAVENLTDRLESMHPYRMVFLHHSVGRGILEQGGLRDSLAEIGVVVKGATYGDDIGQQTDIGRGRPRLAVGS